MKVNESTSNIKVIKICTRSFLLQIDEAKISWIFNAWPDLVKFLIQKDLDFNGIVYPDLTTQKGVSCNLIEFPLLYAMFIKGMYFRKEKPCFVGAEHQLRIASETFRRGLYGFYDVSEMENCDLSREEMHSLMREIEGLSLNGIQTADELFELVPLKPLEDNPSINSATNYHGLRIWKERINVFGIEWKGEQIFIDVNLGDEEEYKPPLKIDIKNITYKLYQIIDTGEEDGFSPRSCMHTVIQWRDKIICVDLPMNVSYLLNRISVSKTEIDAIIFTHLHDDHIGELSLLLQLDKKITIMCPKIIWKSILLKASNTLEMKVEELAEYFDYRPICYGEWFDYSGLQILAHPSIHSVPCAIYRIRGIVDKEWKVYSHLSDILNFHRCQKLIQDGHITQKRFNDYQKFLLEPATVKKIDVGTKSGTEKFSIHGSWKDFKEDTSENIVLAHIQRELLDEEATVMVGQFASSGSVRDMSERVSYTYQDKYRERTRNFLTDYLSSLIDRLTNQSVIYKRQFRDYLGMLSDHEILLIQPHTPFLKMGGESSFVDLVISGTGSIWKQSGDILRQIAVVNAGDLIGDMGALLQFSRNASIRSETYMYVLRIPANLFREIVILLGIFNPNATVRGEGEGILQKIWNNREILQASHFLRYDVPIYIQNRIAQHAVETRIKRDQLLYPVKGEEGTLIITADDPEATAIEINGKKLLQDFPTPSVFGEGGFLEKQTEKYRVIARKESVILKLNRDEYQWMNDVPFIKLRLKELIATRNIYVRRVLNTML